MRYAKDARTRRQYSRDESGYEILPAMVAFPKSEADVVAIIKDARRRGLAITARGGGTGMSGAAVGEGIVVDFTKHMNKAEKVDKTVRVEAGCLLRTLRPAVKRKGLMLPGVPLHSDAAIGGCVNTNSVGPRSLKYGMIDSQIVSFRGVLADGRIIDTAKAIPGNIMRGVARIKNMIRKDERLVRHIMNRPYAAGGYNLRALFEHRKINDIVTHLLVGSVGTLALITEVELSLPKDKEIKNLFLLYVLDISAIHAVLEKIMKFAPTAVEFVDAVLLRLWKGYDCFGAQYALIVAFEDDADLHGIDAVMRRIPKKDHAHLWKSRRDALRLLEKTAHKMGRSVPAGFEDVTFHIEKTGRVLKDIYAYARRHSLALCVYGHLGVGSLHVRVFLDMKKNPQSYDRLGKGLFTILRKHGGTLVGEHNAGRNRSRYLAMENRRMYAMMHRLKRIFDPEDVLNPHIMFGLDPILKDFRPKV